MGHPAASSIIGCANLSTARRRSRHLLAVAGRRGLLLAVAVELVGGQERDGELHPLRDEAGEEVEAEGEDLEEEEVARDVVAGDARGRDGCGGRDGARDADENGHREGVGRHDALQRLHVHFRVAPAQRRHCCCSASGGRLACCLALWPNFRAVLYERG